MSKQTELRVGLTGQWDTKVTSSMLASHMRSGNLDVFATPMLLAGMESAALDAIKDCMKSGQTTVGISANIQHSAPTPLGLGVRFFAELVHISENGKILTFNVYASDDQEQIGSGTHSRAIIDINRFMEKAGKKR